MAGESRKRMIESATLLFQQHGYEATSWRQVATHGAAPTGSIAYVFPGGKEELAVAAVEMSATRTRHRLETQLNRGGAVAELIQEWIRSTAAAFAASDYTEGCPLATITLEMAHRSGAIRRSAEDGFASWRALLTERLSPKLGEVAGDAANILLSAVEGALILARAERSTQALDAVAARVPVILLALATVGATDSTTRAGAAIRGPG